MSKFKSTLLGRVLSTLVVAVIVAGFTGAKAYAVTTVDPQPPAQIGLVGQWDEIVPQYIKQQDTVCTAWNPATATSVCTATPLAGFAFTPGLPTSWTLFDHDPPVTNNAIVLKTPKIHVTPVKGANNDRIKVAPGSYTVAVSPWSDGVAIVTLTAQQGFAFRDPWGNTVKVLLLPVNEKKF